MTGAQPSGSLMTCGQLTLSQLIRLLFPARLPFVFSFFLFFPSLSPLGSNFSLCLHTPEQGEGALFSLSISPFFVFLLLYMYLRLSLDVSFHPLFPSHAL